MGWGGILVYIYIYIYIARERERDHKGMLRVVLPVEAGPLLRVLRVFLGARFQEQLDRLELAGERCSDESRPAPATYADYGGEGKLNPKP